MDVYIATTAGINTLFAIASTRRPRGPSASGTTTFFGALAMTGWALLAARWLA